MSHTTRVPEGTVQYQVLSSVPFDTEVTAKDISARLSITIGSATSALGTLHSKGFLSRYKVGREFFYVRLREPADSEEKAVVADEPAVNAVRTIVKENEALRAALRQIAEIATNAAKEV
jgi:DNA-binding MarR family transcriptional regulator